MTIAITGATGNLGRLAVQDLKARTQPGNLVALVRSPTKAADLGIAAREIDYDQPATLGPALAGVDTLLLISASDVGKRLLQHRNIIAAAKQAGVKRIVYTSLLRADSSPLSNLSAEHSATEAELKASGIPYTILRNGWYTENYTASIPAALANGAFFGSAGDGRISSATRADYAEAAAITATDASHNGKTYELAGDDAYTLADLAAELSLQTGRTIPYQNLPESEYAAALIGAGVPDAMARMFAGWDTGAAHGALFDNGHELSRLIGRPTTPLSIAVRDALALARKHAA